MRFRECRHVGLGPLDTQLRPSRGGIPRIGQPQDIKPSIRLKRQGDVPHVVALCFDKNDTAIRQGLKRETSGPWVRAVEGQKGLRPPIRG